MPPISTIAFLQALYPEPLPAGELVLCSRTRDEESLHAHWTGSLDAAARTAARLRATRDVYFGVGLQDPGRALARARRRRPRARLTSVRGGSDSVVALPALWADLDVAGPGHSRGDLPPDRDAALGLLRAVPQPPSILVASGGGYHAYWLLREPWLLETEDDRREARTLLRRLQGALQAEARVHGWWVDRVADLSRLLRLPGTRNHKLSGPGARRGYRTVTVERFPLPGEARYSASDFDLLPEPAELPEHRGWVHERRERAAGGRSWTDEDWPPSDFRKVFRGCAWMRHAYEDRKTLPEPEWHGALGIAVRCEVPAEDGKPAVDGRRLGHQISEGHPGYTPAATDAKIDHALRGGPRTCRQIAGEFGDEHCRRCRFRGKVRSPILLGRDGPERWPRIPHPGPLPPAPARPGEGAPALPESPLGPPIFKGGRRSHLPPGGAPALPEGTAALPESPLGPPDEPIVLSHREHEVNDRALAVLAARETNLFERGGTLVQVLWRPPADDGCGRPAAVRHAGASPAARPVVEARLQELLARHCRFASVLTTQSGGQTLRPAHPPRWTARALLGRGVWPELPMLEGVVESPVLRRDGSVLQAPGYDAASGLFHVPGEAFEPVPDEPTDDDVAAALALLREVVCDFPFAGEEHFAAWLSALLTPLARAAFDGPSPLNLIDANVPAAGKSLLADVCSLIVTGRPAPRMSYSRDEEELRKAITGLAIEATQMVLVDNVAGAFGGATIDRALTADTWRDRLLGSNEQVAIPLRVTWYVTGNNVELKGDTVRRCLHIRLESPEERPEERTEFRHPRLLRWLAGERRRILPAALTLLRGYESRGRPPQDLPGLGSFESWSDRVRSTVAWLGLPDPVTTRTGLQTGADTEAALVGDLVRGLEEVLLGFGGAATAREIRDELERRPDDSVLLRSALEELFPRLKKGELPTAARLTFKLRATRGRLVDGACIEQGPKGPRGLLWQVRRVAPARR